MGEDIIQALAQLYQVIQAALAAVAANPLMVPLITPAGQAHLVKVMQAARLILAAQIGCTQQVAEALAQLVAVLQEQRLLATAALALSAQSLAQVFTGQAVGEVVRKHLILLVTEV